MTQNGSVPDDALTTNETPRESERDLTPPHGDELRSEVTFGRTDRYTTVDDESAAHQQREAESDEADAEE
jgi:hypothetical protein